MSGGPAFSWNIVTDLRSMLAWQFMVNAFLAGACIAVVAGIMGYFVVLRRSAFANHALGHTGFSGAAAAVLIGVNPVYGLLAFTMVTGGGMALLGNKAASRDVEIGTMLAFALAIGLLFLSLYQGYASEAYSILFGEVLGISWAGVELTFWAALVIMVAVALLYRPLLFSSLDEDVAEAKGMPMLGLGLTFMLLLAITVSIAVQVIGVLLIFALMVTPAAIAVRLTKRTWTAVLFSVLISLQAVWGGLFISWYEQYPPSFFIVGIVFFEYLLVRGNETIRGSHYLQADDVPESTAVRGLRTSAGLGVASQALLLAGFVLLLPTLETHFGAIWSPRTYSASTALALAALGTGAALGVAATLLSFLGYRRVTNSAREFALPTYLSFLGVIGALLCLSGVAMEVGGVVETLAGNTLAPVAILFAAPILATGVLLVGMGVAGSVLGTWRAGVRYNKEPFKLGAVLMAFPVVGQAISCLGYHEVCQQLAASKKGSPISV